MPYAKIGKYDVSVKLSKTERNLIYELKIPYGDINRFGLMNAENNIIAND
jgi:hypothetical protein